jgi:hypothetical protein
MELRMEEGMWNDDISMDEIHQKILKSIMTSGEFSNELQKTFVAALLNLFINANNGLGFFVDFYELSDFDLTVFFREPIIEIFGEEIYQKIENKIRKD